VFGDVAEAAMVWAGLESGNAQLTEIEAARFEIERLTIKIWVSKQADDETLNSLVSLAKNAEQYGLEGGEIAIRAQLAQVAVLAVRGDRKRDANRLLCDLRTETSKEYAELTPLIAEIDRTAKTFELDTSC
jgi:hypothetical protein